MQKTIKSHTFIVEKECDKKQIIKYCDCAFELPVYERDGHHIFLEKLCTYAEFIAACNDTDIMGYAAMYANDNINCVAYISLLAVHPKFQRKHIGKLLIEACIEVAKSKGMHSIKLEVKHNNTNAINFYKRCGFNETGENGIKSYYLYRKI